MKSFNFKSQTLLLMAGLVLSATSHATPPLRGDTVWNGYYFGAYYGAGAGNARTELNSHEQSFTNVPIISTPVSVLFLFNTDISGNLKGKMTGSIADLFFGYNFHEPSYNLVLGAQVEGSIYSDITWKSKGDANSLDTFTILTVSPDAAITIFTAENSISNEETIDRLRSKFALVGRIGYLFTPCTLIYGLGGPVAGHFVLPAFFNFEDDLDQVDNHKNRWEVGYTVGAGLELKINDHWSLRGEYRYLSFNLNRKVNPRSNETNISLDEGPFFVFSSNTFTGKTVTKFHDHLGELGIVYSF